MSNCGTHIVHPSRSDHPVFLSVPHSGRAYDSETLSNARQGQASLQTLEDPLVDRLVWRAIGEGIGAVIQTAPRAMIDCNRGEEEVDPASIRDVSPAPIGPRALHGLGLIASRTRRHGSLWRAPVSRAALTRRLDMIHRPYHARLSAELDALQSRHGIALLIDCHSMPPRRGDTPPIIIGDRHGSSAARWVVDRACDIVRAAGFRVGVNDPFAGGEIITRHGRPDEGRHAIQLEIDRSLYLGPDLMEPGPGFDRIAFLISRLACGLGEALRDQGRLSEAAE